MKKKIILFDIDGTIIDSFNGIKHCVDFALNKLGYSVNEEDYPLFVGPPLINSFKKYAKMNNDIAQRAVNLYRGEYKLVGKNMFSVYPGIFDAILNLKRKGKIIGTATSKPEFMAKIMFEDLGVINLFDKVVGSSGKDHNEEKIDVIKDAISRFNNYDISDYVLIGDTIYDLDAANELGMDCIVVSYGFGTNEVFNKAKYIIDFPQKITDIIE